MILAGQIGMRGAAMRVGYLRGLPCATPCACNPCGNTAQMMLAPAMPMMPVLMMGVAQSGMNMSSETLSEILAILKRLEVLLSESRPPVGPEVDAVLTDALPKLALHIGHGSSDPLFGLVHGWMNHFKAGAPFDVQGLASVIHALEETVASPKHHAATAQSLVSSTLGSQGLKSESEEGEEEEQSGENSDAAAAAAAAGGVIRAEDRQALEEAKRAASAARVVDRVVDPTHQATHRSASSASTAGHPISPHSAGTAALHPPALRTEAFTPDSSEDSALAPAVAAHAALPTADEHGASAASTTPHIASSAAGQAGAGQPAALAPEKEFEAKILAIEAKLGEIVGSDENENVILEKLVELQNGMPKIDEYETSDNTRARRTALVEKIKAKIASLKPAADDAGKVGANEDAAANLVSGELATSGPEVLAEAAAEHGQHGATAPSATAQLVEVQSDVASGLQHSSDEDDEDNEGAAETAGLSTSDESEDDEGDSTINTTTSENFDESD